MGRRREPQSHDWDSQPLGVETDASIARRLGCSTSSVTNARRTRGIPPAPPSAHRPSVPSGIDWDKQPLGRETDTAIAHRLDVHPTTVRAKRIERGIPEYVSLDDVRRDWDERLARDGVPQRLDDAGVRRHSIRRTLERRGLATEVQRRKRRIDEIDWAAVDWAKSNRQLGRELSVSRETVRARRPRE